MKLKAQKDSTDVAELYITAVELSELQKELAPFMDELDNTAILYYYFFQAPVCEIEFQHLDLIEKTLNSLQIKGKQCGFLLFELAEFCDVVEYKNWDNDLFEIIEKILDLIELDNKAKGVLECPICKQKINYTKSEYNGHISAKCETVNCVSFRS